MVYTQEIENHTADDQIIYALEYLLRESVEANNLQISQAIEVAIALAKRQDLRDCGITHQDDDMVAAAIILIKTLSVSRDQKQKLIDAIDQMGL